MAKKTSNESSTGRKKSSKDSKKSTTTDFEAGKEKSSGEKESKDITEFPGYPHYPAQDDIMNPANDVQKTNLDVEDIVPSGKPGRTKPRVKNNTSDDPIDQPVPGDLKEDEIETATDSETDVTKEEIEMLGSDELNTDMGDDEELKQRVYPVDMAGDDLDVPGTEEDDEDEEIGEEDEENNPYSIGGDRHEDLEEEGDPGR